MRLYQGDELVNVHEQQSNKQSKNQTYELYKSLHKQVEYNKGLFMFRVLNNEASEYIFNLYSAHTPSRYSNSRNYQLSFPRPRIDIFKRNNDSLLLCLSVEQPTCDSQILSLAQLL